MSKLTSSAANKPIPIAGRTFHRNFRGRGNQRCEAMPTAVNYSPRTNAPEPQLHRLRQC
ncbi:hypothetical protein [Nostoc sp. DSM 114167]|uniref:hypothetical protein n=1 Tax=Nostoc sp. DSM 114167 TaxID=3439050 RepID=UPI0040460396